MMMLADFLVGERTPGLALKKQGIFDSAMALGDAD
jgi:hypothetical protein